MVLLQSSTKKMRYELPLIIKQAGMVFPFEIIEGATGKTVIVSAKAIAGGKFIVCKQCSSCHGCR